MLRLCSLGSGSGGNALVVEARDGLFFTRVLVDNGFNVRQLARRLERAGLSLRDIDTVLVTHEHSDHAGGVARFACKAGIPVYCSRGTALAAGLEQAGVELHSIFAGVRIELGPLAIDPFAVPHDAAEPLQFVFSDGDRCVGLLTDAGECSELIVRALRRVHALLLECNHDEQMLYAGAYPNFLKTRIGGALGHLSNDQAARIVRKVDCSRLGWIAAAHLSRSNNTPQLARRALSGALGCNAEEIAVADQDDGLCWRAV
ncbi:MAG: MBL fold metallo-hydrolase [Burkholderiaceae bacterium]